MSPKRRRIGLLASWAMAGAAVAQTAAAPADASSAATKDNSKLCYVQVPPEMPRQALLDGVEGTVRVTATVQRGVVRDVQILSGPEAYHQAVKNAMAQYQCEPSDAERTIRQDFNFVVNTDQRTMALCPVQYKPSVPMQVIRQGITSRVVVKGYIENGEVTKVDIVSGHRVYWESVRAAVMKYQCLPMTTNFTQQFAFDFY